jgi:hypothetical protein
VGPPRDGPGRSYRRERPAHKPYNTASDGSTAILPDGGDRQYRARWRLADERYRLGIAALAHQKMPLTVYYSRRWVA